MAFAASDKQTLAQVPRSEFGAIDKVEVHHIPMSFETGEQGTVKIYCPQRTYVYAMSTQVTKALANTDAGTVIIKTSGGTSKGTSTQALSAALGTEADAVVTAFTVDAGSYYQLTSAKTTAGGKVLVQVATRSAV